MKSPKDVLYASISIAVVAALNVLLRYVFPVFPRGVLTQDPNGLL